MDLELMAKAGLTPMQILKGAGTQELCQQVWIVGNRVEIPAAASAPASN